MVELSEVGYVLNQRSDFGEIKHIIYKINKTLFLFKRMDKWKWLSGGGGVNGLRDKNNKSG